MDSAHGVAAHEVRADAAIVVAGGMGRRLGGTALGDKARVPIEGRPMLAHTIDSLPSGLRIVVVAPPLSGGAPIPGEHRGTIDIVNEIDTVEHWVQESPPGSGPLAAIAAGASVLWPPTLPGRDAAVPGQDEALHVDGYVAVLAGDLPTAGDALALLECAAWTAATDVAVIVDRYGRRNPLAALWRAGSLRAALTHLAELAERPVSALFGSHAGPVGAAVEIIEVADAAGVARDIDDPADLDAFVNRRADGGSSA